MAQYHVQRVWDGLLDAERLSRYYGRLAARMQRRHFFFTVFIVTCSTLAAATLLTQLPGLVQAVLSLVVAAAVIWSSYSDYSRKAAISSSIRAQCEDLAVSWKELWSDVSTDQEDILLRAAVLERRLNEVTTQADQYGLIDDALNERCTKETYESLPSELGYDSSVSASDVIEESAGIPKRPPSPKPPPPPPPPPPRRKTQAIRSTQ